MTTFSRSVSLPWLAHGPEKSVFESFSILFREELASVWFIVDNFIKSRLMKRFRPNVRNAATSRSVSTRGRVTAPMLFDLFHGRTLLF
jgi:hypothetical protein